MRCWVKSRNERNPYRPLLTREGEDLTQHLTTRADDNHAPPVYMSPKGIPYLYGGHTMSSLGKVLRVASN